MYIIESNCQVNYDNNYSIYNAFQKSTVVHYARIRSNI